MTPAKSRERVSVSLARCRLKPNVASPSSPPAPGYGPAPAPWRGWGCRGLRSPSRWDSCQRDGDVWEGGNDLFSVLSGEGQCSADHPLDVTVAAGLGLQALPEPKRPERKNPTLFSSSVTLGNQHPLKTSHGIIYIP